MNWEKWPIMLNAKHVSKILGVGLNTTYNLMRTNDFPVIVIGRQKKVPRDALKRWIEENANQ